jgi:hypothetical protein
MGLRISETGTPRGRRVRRASHAGAPEWARSAPDDGFADAQAMPNYK